MGRFEWCHLLEKVTRNYRSHRSYEKPCLIWCLSLHLPISKLGTNTPQVVMLGGIPPSIHHGGARKVASHGMPLRSIQLVFCGFYPRPVLAFGYCRCLRVCVCVCVYVCVCVCVSVNHELVQVIIHQPFKLGSPNLVQRSKTPWLRSLLFLGAIDLDLQGQI